MCDNFIVCIVDTETRRIVRTFCGHRGRITDAVRGVGGGHMVPGHTVWGWVLGHAVWGHMLVGGHVVLGHIVLRRHAQHNIV